MDRVCYEYRFSRHFNRLAFLGMWATDTRGESPSKKIPRFIFRTGRFIFLSVVYLLTTSIVFLQMLDLYLVLDDFEKVTINLSSSAFVLAVLLKFTFMNNRRGCMNKLRAALWQDFLKIEEQEDMEVLDRAYSVLNKMNDVLYSLIVVVIIVVSVTYWYAYWKGSTELPFAGYLPTSYPFALSFEILCFTYIAIISSENELVGFSLLLQVIAHYDVLKNKLRRLDEVYRKETNAMKEVKVLIKHCVRRNLELMEYAKILEHIYSRCMVIQLFVGGFLILMNGVVLLVLASEFSRKLCYGMFIIFMIVSDLLLICHYTSKLALQCFDVGNTAYSTTWYRMDISTQKSLYMLMIGSRKPPKMTAGKIMLMDLHTYMLVLRNILSWLMLIRELVNKKRLAAGT